VEASENITFIERTFDYRIIKKILNHDPLISSDIIYLLDDGNLWSLHKDGDYLRIHANMVTKKGKQAIESAKAAFKWIFNNTDTKKIVARIPKENRKACVIARQCMNFIRGDDHHHHYEVNK